MAVKDWTLEVDFVEYKVVKWLLANGDVGKPFKPAGAYAERCVQVFGTFGTGGKIEIEGTNEASDSPTTWQDLKNFDGTVTLNNITSACMHQILEDTHQIRPICSAGDANTDITVLLLLKRHV